MRAKRACGTGALLVLLPITGGCADRHTRQDAAAAEPDKAVLMEAASPLWTGESGWRLSPEPVVRIGSAGTDSVAQLSRIVGAVRLADGRIVVADAAAAALRLFDPEGRSLGTIGGRGAGPGEFASIGGMARLPGDTILVWDQQQARASVFSPGGELIRSVRLPGLGALPVFVGALADGALVLTSGTDAAQMAGASGSERRDPVVLLHYGPGGDLRDTVGRFAGPEMYLDSDDGMFSRTGVIFGRTTAFAVVRDRVFAAETGGYELVEHLTSGRVARRIRRDVEPRTASRQDLELYRQFLREQNLGGTPGPFRARAAARMQALPHRATLPILNSMLADANDNLWVERYQVPGRGVEGAWDVFDGDGRWLGTVPMPTGLRVVDIGRDYILGVVKDEMEVEQVWIYRLLRPARHLTGPDPP